MLTIETQELQNLSDAKVGDTLDFYYRGNGAHAYQGREVLVEEIFTDGILGKDLLHGGIKRFKNFEASDIEIVDNAPLTLDTPQQNHTLNFVEVQNALRVSLPSVLVDSFNESQAADAYKHYVATDAKAVRFDDECGLYQVIYVEEPKLLCKSNGFDIVKDNGEKLALYTYTSGVSVDTLTRSGYVSGPQELVSLLNEFLG